MTNVLNNSSRVLMLAAALWALIAGAWIFLNPVTVTSQTATVQGSENSDGVGAAESEITVETRTWYQVQGWWGVVVLLAFLGVYGGAAVLFGVGRYWSTGFLSLAAVVLTVLAALSIGRLYIPSALALILAWTLKGFAEFNQGNDPEFDLENAS